MTTAVFEKIRATIEILSFLKMSGNERYRYIGQFFSRLQPKHQKLLKETLDIIQEDLEQEFKSL